MAECKNCGKNFTYCAKDGIWGTYACSESCAKAYDKAILASRSKSKKNSKTDDEIVNEIKEQGVFDMQKSRLERYAPKLEVNTEDIKPIEEIAEPVKAQPYTRRRKNIDKIE